MVSIPDLGWGSVIGNSLEHGFTYMPYGADFSAPCGMEVVLANGELLRTGMGAMPDNKCWHLYKRGFGPTLDQLFMQSNFGVVVKMGLQLMPFPEVVAPIWLNVPRETDLIPLIDTVRRLRLDRTLEGVTRMYNTLLFASLLESGRAGTTATARRRTTSSTRSRATWGSAAGSSTRRFGKTTRWRTTRSPRSRRRSSRSPARSCASPSTRPRRWPRPAVPRDRVLAGVPQMEFHNMLSWYGTQAGAHLGNGPIAPLVGKEAYRLHTLVRDLIENEQQLDYFASPMAISARSYMHACGAIWDVSSEEETRLSYETCRRITRGGGQGRLRRVPRAPERHGPGGRHRTASATMPIGGSSRRSRMPSIRTASSRPASSRSGPPPTVGNGQTPGVGR